MHVAHSERQTPFALTVIGCIVWILFSVPVTSEDSALKQISISYFYVIFNSISTNILSFLERLNFLQISSRWWNVWKLERWHFEDRQKYVVKDED
jgi:hypothetical protein